MSVKSLLEQFFPVSNTNLHQNQDNKVKTLSSPTLPPDTTDQNKAIEALTEKVSINTDDYLAISLRKINPDTSTERNYSITVKPDTDPSKMTKTDYERAYVKQLLRTQGINATDAEVNRLQYRLSKELGQGIEIRGSEQELREIHKQYGELKVATSDLSLAYASAGADYIMEMRNDEAKKEEWARQQAQKYAQGAVLGFYGIQANAVINTVNAATEPIRGTVSGTVGVELPAIPRIKFSDNSEYWQKDHRGLVGEIATTLYVGGKIGAGTMTTTAGKAVIGLESSYNIATGAAGVDPTMKDEQGNYREMGPFERTARVMGGVLGGAAVSSQIKSTTGMNSAAGSTTEAVTAEGVKVRVPIKTDDDGLDQSRALNSSMYGDKYNMFGSAKPSRTMPSSKADPNAKPHGKPEPIKDKEDSITKAAKTRQNESAEILAKAGYEIDQLPDLTRRDRMSNPWFKSTKKPDYLIEGEIFDCYAPRSGTSAENIVEHIRKNKVDQGQARRIVLNMEDSKVTLEDVHYQLINRPVRDLQEVIAIKDGKVFHLYPNSKPTLLGDK
jgi:hypothetical protein